MCWSMHSNASVFVLPIRLFACHYLLIFNSPIVWGEEQRTMLLISFDSGKQQGKRKKTGCFFQIKVHDEDRQIKLIILSLCDKSFCFSMTYFLSFSYFPVFYWGYLLKWLQAMTKEIIGVYQTVFSVHLNAFFSSIKYQLQYNNWSSDSGHIPCF